MLKRNIVAHKLELQLFVGIGYPNSQVKIPNYVTEKSHKYTYSSTDFVSSTILVKIL